MLKYAAIFMAGLAVSAAFATVAPADRTSELYVRDGLVAQWDGLENAGVGVHNNFTQTWVDLTGNGWDAKNGQSVQDLRWNDNSFTYIRNWSWVFYVEKQNLIPSLGSQFTIEAFVKPTANYAQDNAGVFGAHNDGGMGFCGFQYGGGTVSIGTWPRSLLTTTPFSASDYMPAGEYVRLVAQLDGVARQSTIYLNGDEAFQTSPYIDGADATFTNPNFYIGNAYDGSAVRMFDGEFYALRVYNRILTPQELAFNHSLDLYRFCNDTTGFVDLEPTSSYDPATGRLTVSALVKSSPEAHDLLAVIRNPDGSATTNLLAQAATISATPYSIVLGDFAADTAYGAEIQIVCDDFNMIRALPNFYTGAVSISVGEDADAEHGTNGWFVVTRDDTREAMARDLVVNYTVGGTAVAGTDYEALSGAVTIPAGSSSARIDITQLSNAGAGDRTLTLELAAGPYSIDGDADAASMAVRPCSSPWVYDSATGTITDGEWTLNVLNDGSQGLTVTGIVTPGASKRLMLNKPITGTDRVLTGIGTWGYYPFRDQSCVTYVALPDTVTYIYNEAFCRCSELVEVRLSKNLTSINGAAFYSCGALTKVTPALPETVTYIGGQAFEWSPNLGGEFTIGKDGGAPVTLEWRTFYSNREITKMTLKDNVTVIPQSFMDAGEVVSKLETVILPTNLVSIGTSAFISNEALETVTPFLPKTLTYFGSSVFEWCSKLAGELSLGDDDSETLLNIDGWRNFFSCYEITKVTFKANTTRVPQNFIDGGQMLSEVVLSPNVTWIGPGAFVNCSRLRSVTPFLPETVTYVGSSAFQNDYRLAGELEIGTGEGEAVTLDPWAFQNCDKITQVTLGSRVTSLPDHFMNDCGGLQRVILHDDIVTLNSDCFSGCPALTEVLPSPVPAAVTGIGSGIYINCSSLGGTVSIGTTTNVSIWGSGQFENTRITSLTMGAGTSALPYRFCINNPALTHLDIADSKAVSIDTSAFEACSGLTGVLRLPETLTAIYNAAFANCSGITGYDPFVPTNVTYIGDSAFANNSSCQSALEFALSGVPASMGTYVFQNCSKIPSARLGDGITSLPWCDFTGCGSLEYVKLPANLVTLGNSSFDSCYSLRTVEPFLPQSLTGIGSGAFNNCYALEGDLMLGCETNDAPALTSSGTFFYNDNKLNSITFGKNYATINDWCCFNQCQSVHNVYFLGDSTWYDNAFNEWWAYKSRFVVDKDSAYWDAFVADEARCRLPTVEELARYRADFPGEPDPRGLTVINPVNQWIVSYGMVTPGQKDLTIGGKPGMFAPDDVSPHYGYYQNCAPSLPTTLTAPRYTGTNNVLYESLGYVVETPSVKGWGNPVTNELSGAGARSVVFDMSEDGARRFSWLWVPQGYLPDIKAPSDSSLGTVTSSPTDLEGYYSSGSSATFTAVPGPGITFVRWHGDVSEEQAMNAQITIVMDGPKSIQPEFATPWVYTAENWNSGYISDGFWVLNAWVDEESHYTIGTPRTNYEPGLLDLTKPIVGGGSFVAVNNGAFYGNQVIREVRLPETITRIGDSAFRECSIERIEPLLPDSVTLVENLAFHYSTKLQGALRLGCVNNVTIYGGSHFQCTKICDVQFGEGVTDIPGGMFYGCGSLTNVVVTDAITHIGDSSFRECGNLCSFSPLLPASLSLMENLAFYASPIAGNLVVSPTGTPITFYGGSQFQFSQITNAVFGSGVAAIPSAFLNRSYSLKRVEMADNVKVIWDEAFGYCSSLEYVKLPNYLEELRRAVFIGCGALTTVEPFLPSTLKAFYGDNNFNGCTKLASPFVIDVGKRNPVIVEGSGAFNCCYALRDVTLGKTVTSVNNDFFAQCYGIRHLYLKNRTYFGNNAFWLIGARNMIVFVPADNAEWMADLADPAKCTPWAEVHRDYKDAFHDMFPGEKDPYGMLTDQISAEYAPAWQWVKKWRPSEDASILFVR